MKIDNSFQRIIIRGRIDSDFVTNTSAEISSISFSLLTTTLDEDGDISLMHIHNITALGRQAEIIQGFKKGDWLSISARLVWFDVDYTSAEEHRAAEIFVDDVYTFGYYPNEPTYQSIRIEGSLYKPAKITESGDGKLAGFALTTKDAFFGEIDTQYHSVLALDELAEDCSELVAGDIICIEGHILWLDDKDPSLGYTDYRPCTIIAESISIPYRPKEAVCDEDEVIRNLQKLIECAHDKDLMLEVIDEARLLNEGRGIAHNITSLRQMKLMSFKESLASLPASYRGRDATKANVKKDEDVYDDYTLDEHEVSQIDGMANTYDNHVGGQAGNQTYTASNSATHNKGVNDTKGATAIDLSVELSSLDGQNDVIYENLVELGFLSQSNPTASESDLSDFETDSYASQSDLESDLDIPPHLQALFIEEDEDDFLDGPYTPHQDSSTNTDNANLDNEDDIYSDTDAADTSGTDNDDL